MEKPAARENELLQKAISGDMASFEELIKGYEKTIYNIAYRIMGSYDDALDMSQEAFVKIYRKLSSCVDITHFRRWIYAVVNNCCIDELRKRKRRATYSLDAEIETDDGSVERQFVSHDKTPEQALLQKELSKELQNALNLLSPEHKTLVVMRDIRGLSYEELAEITECNLGTVKSRLARARARLKTILLKKAEHINVTGVINPKPNKTRSGMGGGISHE